MFIDIHCHLELLKDLTAILERARKAGVGKIITAGTDVETNRFSLEQANKEGKVGCMLGIYPDEDLKMTDEEIDEEIEFIRREKENIVGVGEVGMDFKHTKDKEGRKRQEKVFRKFISLAMDMEKVVLVHSREAEEECIEILEDMKAKKVIMHCFSGDKELVKRIEKNRWYFSIPTCICYKKSFEEIVKLVPLERLFCETDSPFMHPGGYKNGKQKKNEPANVIASYQKIAEIKRIDLENVKKEIERNYKRLFG